MFWGKVTFWGTIVCVCDISNHFSRENGAYWDCVYNRSGITSTRPRKITAFLWVTRRAFDLGSSSVCTVYVLLELYRGHEPPYCWYCATSNISEHNVFIVRQAYCNQSLSWSQEKRLMRAKWHIMRLGQIGTSVPGKCTTEADREGCNEWISAVLKYYVVLRCTTLGKFRVRNISPFQIIHFNSKESLQWTEWAVIRPQVYK